MGNWIDEHLGVFIIGVVVFVLAVSIGGFFLFKGDSVSSGEITAKVYEPANTYISWIPMWGTMCSGSGTSRSYYSYVMYYLPFEMYDDEDYVFKLKNCDNDDKKCKHGKVYVSRETYDNKEAGDFYKAVNKNELADKDVKKKKLKGKRPA